MEFAGRNQIYAEAVTYEDSQACRDDRHRLESQQTSTLSWLAAVDVCVSLPRNRGGMHYEE